MRSVSVSFSIRSLPPPPPTLFPYTTLFRSRILLGEPVAAAGADEVVVLEATIDDMSPQRSEEHTSELQSHSDIVCRLLLEKKKGWMNMFVCDCCFNKTGPAKRAQALCTLRL